MQVDGGEEGKCIALPMGCKGAKQDMTGGSTVHVRLTYMLIVLLVFWSLVCSNAMSTPPWKVLLVVLRKRYAQESERFSASEDREKTRRWRLHQLKQVNPGPRY
jgi:hypothetical protein